MSFSHSFKQTMEIYVALTFLLIINVSGCPSGWIQDGDTCYFFSKGLASSWADANSYCQAFGYKLAEPMDEHKLNFVKGELNRLAGTSRYYIGGSDFFVEGQWIWSTSQTSIVAHNWEPSEPNNIGTGEDCLTVNHDGLWNDVPCDTDVRFICEAENADVNVIG
ncbi:low affinity immunoglobulin epsilon Fc receptor [Mytilus galloprovincialis]|uniref:Low affinity immunoglobulin epsilon Fc receptor n=2 Tax=Mytilus galloprovincialis TaxID=29158 RepID=A0A8B6EFR7_MYTGA|nr:low affinity immunoglobulin epsilon Fc receptor [Mytilus galloprovincialis]